MTDDEQKVALARVDERLKAVVALLERSDRDRDRSIKIASDDLARRLEVLNHAHEQAQEALRTYLPRQYFDTKHRDLENRVRKTEDALRDLSGRLWLPMLVAAGVAAGLAAALVKLLVHP